MKASGPLTPEMMDRALQAGFAAADRLPAKPRMFLTDQQKRLLMSVGIDPAEAYDLVDPITWSEVMADNPLLDEVIE